MTAEERIRDAMYRAANSLDDDKDVPLETWDYDHKRRTLTLTIAGASFEVVWTQLKEVDGQ